MVGTGQGGSGEREPFRLGRRPPLDGIRAVAIAAVLGVHLGPTKVPGGFLGVDVFLVLSGFLITALLVQERERSGRISLKAFYKRRARRLLPALFIVLAAVAVYGLLFPDRPENVHLWRDILAAIFYCANWVQAAAHNVENGMLSHTWSLSLEEQFYLLWPAALVLMLRRHFRRRTIVIILAVGVVASTVDAYLLLRAGASAPRVQFGLDTRGGGLLVGCLLGLAVGWQVVPAALRRLAPYAPWVGLPLLAVIFVAPRYGFAGGHEYQQFVEAPPLVALATALVIFGVVFAPASLPSRILAIPVIVWVGRVSYGLYLWHFPVVHVFSKDNVTLGLNDTGIQAVRLLVTFAIVTLSFYLVEQPILGGHWPPRFPGRRGRSDAPVVARGDASLRPAEVGTGEASTSST